MRVEITPAARVDVRRIDRETAMRILISIDRYAKTGEGDIKRLQGQSGELRLRVGDYRVRFLPDAENILHILSVRHRSGAYR